MVMHQEAGGEGKVAFADKENAMSRGEGECNVGLKVVMGSRFGDFSIGGRRGSLCFDGTLQVWLFLRLGRSFAFGLGHGTKVRLETALTRCCRHKSGGAQGNYG